MKRYLNNHGEYSLHQALSPEGISFGKPKASEYITAVKLRKAIKTLSPSEIASLFNLRGCRDKIQLYINKLINAINSLNEWEYMKALGILYKEGNTPAFEYILTCKKKLHERLNERKTNRNKND